MTEKTKDRKKVVDELFQVGAHYAFTKSRRHPSAKPYIYGIKNNIEIFNLDKVSEALEKALEFITKKGTEEANLLLVGGKSEAREAIRKAGDDLSMPYVDGRWIGGTLTNFPEIKKRIARLAELTEQREKGELSKYTKKERLLIDRDIAKLTRLFGGLGVMKGIPKVLVIVDPKKEEIAVSEAKRMNIPIVAIAGSDSNLHAVDYPIPSNDSSRQNIGHMMSLITNAYLEGLQEAKKNREAAKEATPSAEEGN